MKISFLVSGPLQNVWRLNLLQSVSYFLSVSCFGPSTKRMASNVILICFLFLAPTTRVASNVIIICGLLMAQHFTTAHFNDAGDRVIHAIEFQHNAVAINTSVAHTLTWVVRPMFYMVLNI